jgi:hypothetical protein
MFIPSFHPPLRLEQWSDSDLEPSMGEPSMGGGTGGGMGGAKKELIVERIHRSGTVFNNFVLA